MTMELDPQVKELLEDAYAMCSCPTFIQLNMDCTQCDAVAFCDLSKWLAKFKEVLPFPSDVKQPEPLPDAVMEAIGTNVFNLCDVKCKDNQGKEF